MADLRQMFDAIDLKAVEAFVKDRAQETLHLEFKTLADSAKFQPGDKKNLAKCISGFANSAGGIIVWGVQTKTDGYGVDAAASLDPIPDTRATLSRLQSFTPDAAHPIVDGVLHEQIPLNADEGFLKTFVPESDSTPHMAKFHEDRYFKRSGDSFRRMEHFDIADMFGRRPKPVLSLFTKAVFSGHTSGQGKAFELRVIIGIENLGRGIAKYPSISIETDPPPHGLCGFGLDGNGRTGLPEITGPRFGGPRFARSAAFGGGSDHVVHAQSVLEVTRTMAVQVRVEENDNPDVVISRQHTPPDLRISYRITADEVLPVVGEKVVTGIGLLKEALAGWGGTLV